MKAVEIYAQSVMGFVMLCLYEMEIFSWISIGYSIGLHHLAFDANSPRKKSKVQTTVQTFAVRAKAHSKLNALLIPIIQAPKIC